MDDCQSQTIEIEKIKFLNTMDRIKEHSMYGYLKFNQHLRDFDKSFGRICQVASNLKRGIVEQRELIRALAPEHCAMKDVMLRLIVRVKKLSSIVENRETQHHAELLSFYHKWEKLQKVTKLDFFSMRSANEELLHKLQDARKSHSPNPEVDLPNEPQLGEYHVKPGKVTGKNFRFLRAKKYNYLEKVRKLFHRRNYIV